MWETSLPLTTTSVAIDTLSTLVWTAHVYFPACFSLMFRIMMSPAERCQCRSLEKQKTTKRERKKSVKRLIFLQVQNKLKRTVETSPMPKWFLLAFSLSHYGAERYDTSPGTRQMTEWNFSWSFMRTALCEELKSFFQLYPFYSLQFHLLCRQPFNAKCIISFEL